MKVILIVEGWKDAEQIHRAFEGNADLLTVVTEGTKFNNRVIAELEQCMRQGDCAVYIFSDPDEAGNQLSEMVRHVFPDIPRIDADADECSYFTGKRKKAGIEYASYRYLRKLISPFLGLDYIEEETINWE